MTSKTTMDFWFKMLNDGLDAPFSSLQAYQHICNYTVYTNGGARRRTSVLPANVSAVAQLLRSNGRKYGIQRVNKMTAARNIAQWDFVD